MTGLLLLTGCILLAPACLGDAAPVAVWSFDETGEHGAVTHGEPSPASGVEGQSLRFDGVKDYTSVPDSGVLSFPDATFTVTAWANVYALCRGQQMIVAKNVYSANQREWGLMVDEDSHFRFYLHRGGWKTVGSETVPTPGRWYHLAVTLDAGHTRLYVNGKLEAEARLGSPVPDTAAPLTIGGINDGGWLRQMWPGHWTRSACMTRRSPPRRC